MKKLFLQVYPLARVYVVYTLVGLISGTSATLSVVLSESMEPQIQRGDLLFAVGPKDLRVGDIVLYELPHRTDKIPIVHRIIQVLPDGRYLTKGDNNRVDDRALYWPSFDYLPKEAIIGKVRGHVPWIGYATLIIHPHKSVVIALVAISVLHAAFFKREDPTAVDNKPETTLEWIKYLLYPISK